MSKLVGSGGKVFGIDMTDNMLQIAIKNNAEYIKKVGYLDVNINLLSEKKDTYRHLLLIFWIL